jgi:serine/threonine-protein kinase
MASFNLVGKWLGNYQILEELGRGGMAVVYRAYQPSLNREVALKVLSPQLAFDEQFVERFQREARAAAGLNHPNIVTIYDVGQQDSYHYIVMELLEGQTLRQLIEREGALPPLRTTRIVEQVAGALDYAHQRGFIHRDVKPSNIFVGPGDRVTLTDFGIAKAAWGTRLTQTGTLIGTPEYMSPEQVQGQEASARSDVYALAVVAYQMLSGQVPFEGTTPHAVLYKQVHEAPPSLSSLRPGLPPALEGVLRRGLAKDPAARYASAGAFARALSRAVGAPVPVGAAGAAAIGASATGPTTMPGTTAATQLEDDEPRSLPFWVWALAAITAVVLIASLVLVIKTCSPVVDSGATDQALAHLHGTQTAEALPTTAPPEPTFTLAPTSTPGLDTDTPTTETPAEHTPLPVTTEPVPSETPPLATTEAAATDTPPVAPTPVCAIPADPQLASQWERGKLGCPEGLANIVWAAWEPFQGAYLIWRIDTDGIYVMYLADGNDPWRGDWFETPDAWKWDGSNPDGVGLNPPPGLYEPLRGFGYIWREFLGGPSGPLGWATDEEKGFCVNIQSFEQGLMFHSSTVEFCEDQLFNWARDPSFAPLYFSLYGDGAWQRH